MVTTTDSQVAVGDRHIAGATCAGDTTTHGLFTRQAIGSPDAVALMLGPHSVTYEELNRRSNQLAHYLRRFGASRGTTVGICLERSVELIVAVLGVLKTGAAYVPLDPAYPQQRLAHMAQAANIVALVTSSRAQNPRPRGETIVRLDLESPSIAAEPTTMTHVGSADDLAYVMYTSGSTGNPKGVAMPHRALLNLLAWQAGRSHVHAGARTVQFTPISFDVSFQEIFSTLCSGGTLVLAGDDVRRDPQQLLDLLARERVNRIFLPFVALQALCDMAAAAAARLPALTEVITAGEQLTITPSVTAFFTALPQCTLDNQYGPTECHVVTAHLLHGPPASWPALPPIGRPITNARIYLLDERRCAVPAGTPGEIHVGGVPLALGYYGRPDLTSERFVANPFVDGEVIYRTGDLGRWLPDGTIEFMGRIDDQVKVRGHRVEPGEIETAISRFPMIQAAAVAFVGTDAGLKRLVAYVVSRGGALDMRALRSHLEEQLPEYMVPDAYVQLASLPLSPAGKVQRRLLPPPADAVPPRFASDPPTTATQETLVRIWREVLDHAHVGVRDDFFQLGGHSLTAARMFARLREEFGRGLPVSTLLQRPTIEQLADLLGSQPTPVSSVVPLRTGGHKPPLFFIHGLDGEIWIFRDLAKHLGPDQPVFGIQYTGASPGSPVSIPELARSYIREIISVAPHGPILLGAYCLGAATAFEIAQECRRQGRRVALLAVFEHWFPDAEAPFTPAELAVNVPHWVKDEWLASSMQVNTRRLKGLAGRVFRRMRRLCRRAARSGHEEGARNRAGVSPEVPQEPVSRPWYVYEPYEFTPYEGTVAVFRARSRDLLGPNVREDMGWRRIALGEFSMHTIPGGHTTMMLPPNAAILAERLRDVIDAATSTERWEGAGAATDVVPLVVEGFDFPDLRSGVSPTAAML